MLITLNFKNEKMSIQSYPKVKKKQSFRTLNSFKVMDTSFYSKKTLNYTTRGFSVSSLDESKDFEILFIAHRSCSSLSSNFDNYVSVKDLESIKKLEEILKDISFIFVEDADMAPDE